MESLCLSVRKIVFKFDIWLYIDGAFIGSDFGCCQISTVYFVGLSHFSLFEMVKKIWFPNFTAPAEQVGFKFRIWFYIYGPWKAILVAVQYELPVQMVVYLA